MIVINIGLIVNVVSVVAVSKSDESLVGFKALIDLQDYYLLHFSPDVILCG